jgi:carboxylesterase
MSKAPYGFLILHGFLDNISSIRTIETSLLSLGLPIHTPLLRGHGAESPHALKDVKWKEWVVDANSALEGLLAESEKVIIIGFSMGGAIALLLAADHKEKIDSMVLAAPAVHLINPFAPGRPLNFLLPLVALILKRIYFPYDSSGLYQNSYAWAPITAIESLFDLSRMARSRLPEIKVPALLIQGRKDHTIAQENIEIIFAGLATPAALKQVIWFEKSGHGMFDQSEKEDVIRVINHYVRERIGAG